MALLDETLTFTDGVSLAGGAGIRVIGLPFDLGSQPGRPGGDLRWIVRVKSLQEASGGNAMGAGQVRFHLVSDASAAIATDGSASLHFSTGWLDGCAWDAEGNLTGDLTAGATVVNVPLPGGNYEPHLGVLLETSAAGMASGSVASFLSL